MKTPLTRRANEHPAGYVIRIELLIMQMVLPTLAAIDPDQAIGMLILSDQVSRQVHLHLLNAA